MNNGQASLRESVAMAAACVHAGAAAQTFALADDPLQLNLPPLLSAARQLPSAATIRAMAALYFHAEIEQAGVIPVAELLATSRLTLDVRGARVSSKLHKFAERARHDWYDQQSRNITYARVFGFGMTASLHEGNSINNDFHPRLATLCSALLNYQRDYFHDRTPGPLREVQLREAATLLLLNLGSRQYGNLVRAAQLIHEQQQAAVDLLNDPELATLFRGRGMWDVLRAVLGSGTPDLGRLIQRGESGLRLLNWLASALPTLTDPVQSKPILPVDSQVYAWAASWLVASGIDIPALSSSDFRR